MQLIFTDELSVTVTELDNRKAYVNLTEAKRILRTHAKLLVYIEVKGSSAGKLTETKVRLLHHLPAYKLYVRVPKKIVDEFQNSHALSLSLQKTRRSLLNAIHWEVLQIRSKQHTGDICLPRVCALSSHTGIMKVRRIVYTGRDIVDASYSSLRSILSTAGTLSEIFDLLQAVRELNKSKYPYTTMIE
jgi:hypothetical protein